MWASWSLTGRGLGARTGTGGGLQMTWWVWLVAASGLFSIGVGLNQVFPKHLPGPGRLWGISNPADGTARKQTRLQGWNGIALGAPFLIGAGMQLVDEWGNGWVLWPVAIMFLGLLAISVV